MKALYYIQFIMIASAVTLTSCKEQPEKRTDIPVEEKQEEKEKAISVKTEIPEPIHIYTNDTVSVDAYDYKGLEYFLTMRNDTTYVVNFWATWCEPCVEELPYFEKLNKQYKKNKVKVLLVSLDMKKDLQIKLLPFVQRRQLKSDVLILSDTDSNTWIPKVDSTWTGAIPATLIYNKDHRKFYEKSFTFETLEKEVSNFK